MSLKFMGFSIITDDVLKLAKFYGDVLCCEAESDPIHSFVHADGVGIAIYSKKAAQEDMGFDFSRYWGSGNITLSFFVDDVDAEYNRIKQLGAYIEIEPTTHPWGSRAMQFRDPDGNIVTFACRV